MARSLVRRQGGGWLGERVFFRQKIGANLADDLDDLERFAVGGPQLGKVGIVWVEDSTHAGGQRQLFGSDAIFSVERHVLFGAVFFLDRQTVGRGYPVILWSGERVVKITEMLVGFKVCFGRGSEKDFFDDDKDVLSLDGKFAQRDLIVLIDPRHHCGDGPKIWALGAEIF